LQQHTVVLEHSERPGQGFFGGPAIVDDVERDLELVFMFVELVLVNVQRHVVEPALLALDDLAGTLPILGVHQMKREKTRVPIAASGAGFGEVLPNDTYLLHSLLGPPLERSEGQRHEHHRKIAGVLNVC